MQQVVSHFKQADPVMARLVEAGFKSAKPIKLRPPVEPKDYFYELAESIVSQQLSVKAADTIWQRMVKLLGRVTPQNVLKHDVDSLRKVGISRQKASYLLAMAKDVSGGSVELGHLGKLDDDVVIEELVKLKGVGTWTAEMFLMFTLGRPDVFSYGDLGLKKAFEQAYNLGEPSQADMEPVVNKWKPYRTYAALALWHSKDNPPNSER